jgi:hypothetical protein
MSRVSSLVFGTVALATVAIAGCKVEVTTKHRFREDSVVREDTTDWGGGPIKIDIDGVGAAINGGVKVVSDPKVTKVKATARMLAMAYSDEKENADLSIAEAKNTFTVAADGTGVLVSCDHGGAHGSSERGLSGCELVDIVVPAGTADKPLLLEVLSGNGTMTLQLPNTTIKNLGANSNGGDIEADVPATQGGNISLVAEKADNISVKLPSSWTADEVILQADADKIHLGPYTDVKSGAGAGGRGNAGIGLASLKLTSKEFAGSTGEITLR